jgi:hypothetical protein
MPVLVVGVGWLFLAFGLGCVFGKVARHGRGDDFEDRLEELEEEADTRREVAAQTH